LKAKNFSCSIKPSIINSDSKEPAMSIDTNNRINTPYVPPPPSGVGQAGGVDKPKGPSDSQGVRPPGGLSVTVGSGEVSYSSPNLEGIDWDALTSDYKNVENVAVSMTAILVLLVEAMKEMRKSQREAWMDEAQNALQQGLNAADQMRSSAVAKLAADVVSNAAAIVTASVSLIASSIGAAKGHKADIAIEAKATDLFGPKIDNAALAPNLKADLKVDLKADLVKADVKADIKAEVKAEVKADVELTQAKAEVKADAEIKQEVKTEVEVEGGINKETEVKADVKADAEAKTEAKTEATTEAKTETKSEAKTDSKAKADAVKKTYVDGETLANQKDRAKWVTQEKANWQAGFDQGINIAKTSSEIGASMAKTGAAIGEYISGRMQAQAKEFEAQGSYSQALMQAELEFANQTRDSIRAILDTLKSVESAKHQATQGIYNI
jgi:hypothetical protein